MYFLRQESIEINGQWIKIKELTFRQLLIFLEIKTLEAQLLFILDGQRIEGKIPPGKICEIFEAFGRVNKSIEREPPKGPSMQITMEEQVDFLCKRWGQNPLDLINRFSKEMVFEWNHIGRSYDYKVSLQVDRNDVQSKVDRARANATYQKLKKNKPVKNMPHDFFKKFSRRGVN